MDSFDPQQIAEDREIVAEAVARARIRPLFRSGEATGAGAAKRWGFEDQAQDTGADLGPPPIGEDPSALSGGHSEGP